MLLSEIAEIRNGRVITKDTSASDYKIGERATLKEDGGGIRIGRVVSVASASVTIRFPDGTEQECSVRSDGYLSTKDSTTDSPEKDAYREKLMEAKKNLELASKNKNTPGGEEKRKQAQKEFEELLADAHKFQDASISELVSSLGQSLMEPTEKAAAGDCTQDGGVGSGVKGHVTAEEKEYKNEIGKISKEQYESEQAAYQQYGKDRDYKKYILALRKIRGEEPKAPVSQRMMEIKNVLNLKSREQNRERKFNNVHRRLPYD
jgi:hypothetical protein